MLALDSDKVTWMSRSLLPTSQSSSDRSCLSYICERLFSVELIQQQSFPSSLWLRREQGQLVMPCEGQGQTGRMDRSIHLLRLHPVYSD
jgi:hypothetical protein